MDIITSNQDSDRESIPLSDVHDLFSKIHDIIEKALSEGAGKEDHILAFHF